MTEQLKTGRHEAHATPSNFMGEYGVHMDNPTNGTPVDYINDDPADVENAVKSLGKFSDRQVTDTGVTAREQRHIDEFENRQDELRRRYQGYVSSGFSPDEARKRALSKSLVN